MVGLDDSKIIDLFYARSEQAIIARLSKEYIIWDYIIKKGVLFTDKIIRIPELSGQSCVSGVIKHLKDFMT